MELSSKARAFSVEALIGLPSHQQNNINKENKSPVLEGANNDEDLKNIQVELCSRELWEQFHSLGTEMIVTKAGRRMFPAVKVRISGMNPSAYYILYLDIVPVDEHRYRYGYCSSQWTVASQNDNSSSPPPLSIDSEQYVNSTRRRYIHPESPATGQLWMTQDVIAFDRLKLTNNRYPLVQGQVSLLSMHKYVPRVHILVTRHLELSLNEQISQGCSISITYPVTTFLTVTAYQNQQITRLKIASNPFAKGFRERSREEANYNGCYMTHSPKCLEWISSSGNPAFLSRDKEEDKEKTLLRPFQAPVRVVVPKKLSQHSNYSRPWLSPVDLSKNASTNL